MADYLWYGEDNKLQQCQGMMVDRSVWQLRSELANQGIHLRACYRVWFWHRRTNVIDTKATLPLFLQWQRLLAAGLPLFDCVRLAKPKRPTGRLRWQLWLLQQGLQQGYTLSQICAQQGLLANYQVALLAAGEQQSNLALALQQLAQQQQQTAALLKKLRTSLMMPAITLGVGIVVCILILLFLVPNIASLVAHSQAPIPLATQYLLTASTSLHQYGRLWLMWLCGLVVVLFAISKTPRGQGLGSLLLAHIPGWRGVYLLQSQYLVMQLLASSLASGLPLLQGLELCRRACANRKLARQLQSIANYLQSGVSLSQAFTQGGFDDTQVVMLRLAEKSGDMAGVFDHLSEQLRQALGDKIDTITRLLEPMITSFLALVVGSLVVAIYLPLMQMGSLL
ncbi:MAG TPA: hypothetical protein DE179_13100 [Oceanospirillaceae bacterium]|nr:hypothetical protein [Oceanospirillaceae bacterium]